MSAIAELAALGEPSVTVAISGRQVTVRKDGITYTASGETVEDAAREVLDLMPETEAPAAPDPQEG